jgi:formylglycine-generating enzyme required for sulfatase activity
MKNAKIGIGRVLCFISYISVFLVQASCSSPLNSYEFETVKVDSRGNIVERRKGEAKYFSEDLGGGVTLEMVEIPAGTFTMGSPLNESQRNRDEEPQHQVSVRQFYLGKFEVTYGQWRAVAGLPKVERDLDPKADGKHADNMPVDYVTWDDAVEFCKRLSQKTGREYRLPSEAEWEYAARAGTTTPFAFGVTLTTEIANFMEYSWILQKKGVKPTVAVGSYGVANGFGLYDTQGNVEEWCLDWYHSSYSGAPTDGSAWVGGAGDLYRVSRGGAASASIDVSRSAHRSQEQHDERSNNIGFRVVSIARP